MSWKTLNNASGDVDLPTKAEMDAQRGLPADTAWNGTDAAASHTSIFKRMANFLTTLGSLGDAAWDGTSANPSIVAVLKRQAALLSDTTAAKVDTVVSGAAVNQSKIIGWAGTTTAASSASTTLIVGSTYGVPTVGDTIAGTGITTGTTITAVSGTSAPYTLTLSAAMTVASGVSVYSTLAVRQIMAANATRRWMAIQNQHASARVWMNGITTATADGNSLLIKPGDYYETSPVHVGVGAISVITDAPGSLLYAREA